MPSGAGFFRTDVDASLDLVRSVDIVTWLVEHQTELSQIDSLAGEIGQACSDLLMEAADEDLKNKWRHRLADHFWCGVIAALVREISDFQQIAAIEAGVLAKNVWATVVRSRSASRGGGPWVPTPSQDSDLPPTRGELDRQQAGLDPPGQATSPLQKATSHIITVGCAALLQRVVDVNPLLLKLRVLAVLLCPDPPSHTSVWDDCWCPLAGEEITSVLQLQLVNVLPGLAQQATWAP